MQRRRALRARHHLHGGRLDGPTGLELDGDRLYIADTGSNRVRLVMLEQ
jgi:hypothetical protein